MVALKSVFSRHRISETVISDNGPQYDSKEMKEFVSTYGFKHVTSSPYYPRGNSLAERMVKTVKALLKESPDVYLALLSYRATPLPWCQLSPPELLIGRRILQMCRSCQIYLFQTGLIYVILLKRMHDIRNSKKNTMMFAIEPDQFLHFQMTQKYG